MNKCKCTPDETTGWTEVKCCNICGNPIEDFWCINNETLYTGKEVANMMKASYKAGVQIIDLKKLQSVLHNVQQVMAGYSQDDTWSDYDRQAHTELIEMQYIVEAEIKNVKPQNDIQCGNGQNIA